MAPDAISGHCLCGAVSIAVIAPANRIDICHCDMCRRWGGAFYPAVEGASFEVSGEKAINTYASSEWAQRAFCSRCGSNLLNEFMPTGRRSFLAGILDAASGYPVAKEIFVDEQPEWYVILGDHPRQTGKDAVAEAEAAGFSFE